MIRNNWRVKSDTLVFRSSIALGPTYARAQSNDFQDEKRSRNGYFKHYLNVYTFLLWEWSLFICFVILANTRTDSIAWCAINSQSKKWKSNGMQIDRYESDEDGNEETMMMKAMYWQQRDKINMRYRLIGRYDSYKWISSVCLHLQTWFVFSWVVEWNCDYHCAEVVAFFSGEYIFWKNARRWMQPHKEDCEGGRGKDGGRSNGMIVIGSE